MKSINFVCFCLTIVAFVPAARAEEADGLRAMIHRRSSADLTRLIQSESRHQRLKLVCEAQLRHLRVPTACFEVGDREAGDWLKALCRKRASASLDNEELASAANQASLPPECRRAAEERRADLRYSQASEHPAKLWRED